MIHTKMEATIANVDLGRYRRIVQMFWDPEPANDSAQDQPVWCLGRSYQLHKTKDVAETRRSETELATPPPSDTQPDPSQRENNDAEETSGVLVPSSHDSAQAGESASSSFSSSLAYGESNSELGHWPQGFLDDFESRFWMTYRSEFEAIPKSKDPKATSALSLSMRIKSQLVDQSSYTSDTGWGCMIRSGQSLLANAITILRLGRDWRRGKDLDEERCIARLFADDPRAPYSIHKFVQYGAQKCGKYPGEWFGPSATAHCIKALANDTESQLRVYSTGDGPDVYADSFLKIAQPDGEVFHPTLILIGTRLGIDKITPVYWDALIATLQISQSIGIAGGRPSSSHYFVGAQGSFLFYLDPHQTRPAFPFHQEPSDYTEEEMASCHTTRLRRLHVKEMDPSMLIGFLIRSNEDWEDWRRSVKHVQGKAVIHVSDHNPLNRGVAEGREGAIDEVETLSDDGDDDNAHLV